MSSDARTTIDSNGEETLMRPTYFVVVAVESLCLSSRVSWYMLMLIVKDIYVSWSNHPPNTKFKDWNVAELKVCGPPQPSPTPQLYAIPSILLPQPDRTPREQVDRSVVA